MQEYPKLENRKLFFLLSLLLHLLLLYICFQFLSYQNSSKSAANKRIDAQKELNSSGSALPPSVGEKPEERDQDALKDRESQELAEMKAQQSAFGAPVIFQEMPESIPAVASNETEQDTGSHPEPLEEAESTLKDHNLQEQELVAQQSTAQEHILPDLSPEARPTPLATQAAISQAQDLLEHTIAALENKEPEKPTQQTAQKKSPRQPRRPSPRSKTTTALNQGNSKRSAGPADKKFTFADLANGFMENLQTGGQDAINQRGNPNKRPGIEQLKQASYKQKMAWNLQAAFKRAARRTKFMIPSPEHNRLECTFHISKEGVLEKIDIISSTGHQELDSYIVATIKDAFPLPPIPDHWAQEMLVQSWVFRNIQPNESSYTVNF